jgi:hypothetical protein
MDEESFQTGESPEKPDLEALLKELARINREIEAIRGERGPDQGTMPPVEPDEDRMVLITDVWQELSDEEKSEWLENFLRVADEQWEEISANPELAVLVDRLRAVARDRQKLIEAEDKLTEALLQATADHADAMTLQQTVLADMMKHFENLADEDWQEMETSKRLKLMDLLTEWNNGGREECLSQLPIEIRRRYE